MNLQIVSQSPKLSDKAYKIIKDAIISNELKPGEILAESRLAEKLQISRTPIKTALSRLVFEEIAEINDRNNVVVSDVTAKDMEDLTIVREAVEIVSIKLLKDRMNNTMLNEIEEIIKKQETALLNNDSTLFLDMDFEFHVKLAKYSENQFLLDEVTKINTLIKRYLILSGNLIKCSKLALEEHREVIEALKYKNFEKAKTAMKYHLINVNKRMFNEI